MVDTPAKERPRKGRGSLSNASGRFEPTTRQLEDDGWENRGLTVAEDETPPPLRTQVGVDRARQVITRNDSPDLNFDRSINPYRGCEHGCIYCFARPSHAYLGLSPGLDFETRLFAKPEADRLLRAELAKPGYKVATMALGTNTDPYQPVERRQEVTRRILAVLAETKHPVSIVTKSDLVLRDLDILAPLGKAGLANVMLSVTTLDPKLARVMEPRAASPAKRLSAIAQLNAAGVPAGVLFAPVIPAINDHEMEKVVEAAAARGATRAGWVLLRLPLEIKQLFEEWLEAHFPDRKKKVLDLIRQARGGQLYDSRWGTRQTGEGVYAQLIATRFRALERRLRLAGDYRSLDCSQFKAPPADVRQMQLF